MNVHLGCGQITWRHELAGEHSEDEVLGDIAGAGYEGAPFGDPSRSAADIQAAFDRHGLKPAPGYIWGDFWEPSLRDEQIENAKQHARRSQELGLTEIYIAAGGFDIPSRSGRTRRQAVAHSTPEESLTDEQYAELARTLQAVGEATLEFGVRASYHNHGGTFIEREDELERLLGSVDPEVLFLGIDTGHLAWAGVDVVPFARRHGSRITTMHLKDVDAAVRAKGVAEGWDYAAFEANALWTEVGNGSVDFAGLFQVLSENDFDGWLIVETDVTQLPSAAESARISRENLRKLGI